MTPKEILKEISCADKQRFSPELVDALVDIYDELDPYGTRDYYGDLSVKSHRERFKKEIRFLLKSERKKVIDDLRDYIKITDTGTVILEVEEWGISIVYKQDYWDETNIKYRVIFPDPASPQEYTEEFNNLKAAVNRVTELILDPKQIYAMEDQPSDIQKAYQTVETMPLSRCSTFTLLQEVLYSIARKNEEDL